MNRRSAIRNLAIVAGGMLILPSCAEDRKKGKSSVQLAKLKLDAKQEELLSHICEAVIPATDTPGAKELHLHLFVIKMVDDCYEPETQEKFVKGLSNLQHAANNEGKRFADIGLAEQQKLLLAIENSKDDKSDMGVFYGIMKSRTIQGYRNSKYVMTNISKYELIPGRYNGYFPVKAKA